MVKKENKNPGITLSEFDQRAKHEMGREVGIDYRGLKRLEARLTKGKAPRRDKMF